MIEHKGNSANDQKDHPVNDNDKHITNAGSSGEVSDPQPEPEYTETSPDSTVPDKGSDPSDQEVGKMDAVPNIENADEDEQNPYPDEMKRDPDEYPDDMRSGPASGTREK